MQHTHPTTRAPRGERTRSQMLADGLASAVGSWQFIIAQAVILIVWLAANSVWLIAGRTWDPYPFILLNLTLSTQAAFTGPIVMLSQNRQAEHDRNLAQGDFQMDLETNEMVHQILAEVEELKSALHQPRH